MGVADITSTWGRSFSPLLAARAARWSTPNRCCSSVMTSPSRRKDTPSLSSAWVPQSGPAPPRQGRPAVSLLGGGHGAHQKPHPEGLSPPEGFPWSFDAAGPTAPWGPSAPPDSRSARQNRRRPRPPPSCPSPRPLQQAVHGNSPPQIRRRFLHRPQLGRG